MGQCSNGWGSAYVCINLTPFDDAVSWDVGVGGVQPLPTGYLLGGMDVGLMLRCLEPHTPLVFLFRVSE